MSQEKIKKQIQEIYKLDSEPYWYIGCVKWAERTKEILIFSKESNIKIEEAADKAAKEVFSNYGIAKRIYDNSIETKSFTMMSIQTLLDEINKS